MVQINIDYLGDLMCKVTHTPSGNSFFTDAPLDNTGQARYISPTDLLAASIGSCIATIMGIKANTNGINIEGLKITVGKEMDNLPFRRVSKLTVRIYFATILNEKDFIFHSDHRFIYIMVSEQLGHKRFSKGFSQSSLREFHPLRSGINTWWTGRLRF